jgi:branched-subunit amino acid transport protein
MTDLRTLAIIVGLAVVTVVARSFFFLSSRPWPLPRWVERGLQYAPIAALSAVVLPEILTLQGQWSGVADARVVGAVAGAAAFAWRRSVLLTIAVGMAAYLPFHLLLGW